MVIGGAAGTRFGLLHGQGGRLSALLSFSRVMLEKFAGTPLAKHWEGTP